MKLWHFVIGLLAFIVLMAAFSPPARAQDGGTVPLSGNIPAALTGGSATRTGAYLPTYVIQLTIHLADLGDDQDTDFAAVMDWLKNSNMNVTDTPPGHRIIEAATTVKNAEDFFQVSIDQYEIRSTLYYANSQPPSIPVALNGIVTSIDGLDNFPP